MVLSLPVILFLGPDEGWWRPALQALPTGPALQALHALDRGAAGLGLAWAAGALCYAAGLLALAVAASRR